MAFLLSGGACLMMAKIMDDNGDYFQYYCSVCISISYCISKTLSFIVFLIFILYNLHLFTVFLKSSHFQKTHAFAVGCLRRASKATAKRPPDGGRKLPVGAGTFLGIATVPSSG